MILAEENRSAGRKHCLYVTLSTIHPTWTCLETRQARGCLKNINIYGWIILNSILEKWNGEVFGWTQRSQEGFNA